MRTEASAYMHARPEGAWQPTYDFVLGCAACSSARRSRGAADCGGRRPGEAVFFPTSWLHETRNLNGTDSSSSGSGLDGCSLSLSLQWRYPFPVGFIRDFAPRLVRAKETHFCFEHWAPFITGDVDGVRRLAFPVLSADASAQPAARRALRRTIRTQFSAMDGDGDGFVTLSEKTAHFERVWRTEMQAGALVEFEPSYEAADWLAFHDEKVEASQAMSDAEVGGDGDGRGSLAEWERSITHLVDEYVRARRQGAVDVEDEPGD